MKENIDKSGVIALVITFLITLSLSIIALYRGVNWQNILSDTNKWIVDQSGNEVVALIFIVIALLIAYVFIGVGLHEILRVSGFVLARALVYIYLEFAKLYFLILLVFFIVTVYVFNKSEDKLFTSDVFFKITIFTFIISLVSYFLIKKGSKISLKNNKRYCLAKENEKKMFNEFEIGGMVNALVIVVTVLLLADTIGNTAYDSVIKQINCDQILCEKIKSTDESPSLDDFINSRIFFLMIPSLAVYILSIRLGFPKGFKKI